MSMLTMTIQALSASTSHATCLKDRPERESRVLDERRESAAQQPSPAAPEQRRLTEEEARIARIADFEGLGFPKTEEEARLTRLADFEAAARAAERPVREELRNTHAAGMVASRGTPGHVGQGGVEPSEGWPELVTPEKQGSTVLSI